MQSDRDSDMSMEDTPGHEEETFTSQETKDEVSELTKKVEELEQINSHLEWHCAIYRKTLEKVSNGYELMQAEVTSARKKRTSHCNQCEIEKLLAEINALNQKLLQDNLGHPKESQR